MLILILLTSYINYSVHGIRCYRCESENGNCKEGLCDGRYCQKQEYRGNEYNKARLLLTLPTEYNTPDGAAIDSNGDIYLSIPNFSNDYLIDNGRLRQPAPAVMAKIDRNNRITTWYQFRAQDMHPETGKIGPMDAAFGPDGNLYIADMQIFFNNDHKSRLVRINVQNGTPTGMDVLVEGFVVANGVAWKGNMIFVSDTALEIRAAPQEGQPLPPLKSGVYAFTLDELSNRNRVITLLPYSDRGGADQHLVVEFRSSNRVGFGADGITFDGAGNLYTAILEDGFIYKTELDSNNRAVRTELFASDRNMVSADGLTWNPDDNKFYAADFLGNAVHSIDMDGRVTTLHKNGDTNGADGSLDQPCEVIVRGNELIIVNMDMAWATPPNLGVDTTVDQPYTVSVIQLDQLQDNDNGVRTMKGCTQSGQNIGCLTLGATIFGYSGTSCLCDTDFCNSGRNLVVSIWLIALGCTLAFVNVLVSVS